MTTTDDPHVAAVAAATKRFTQARENLEMTILEALRQPGAKPTKIAAASPWTPAYVRAFARKNGIEPDPSYKQRAASRKTDDTTD
ncbi:hypothetical protein [Kitasatospora sp. NPDC047058]|uniref:hypothetical protein n=1 Tax=Kitasatospora sp. NPDC047058 TaxID=3155620 RepID=UPI0033F65A37